MAGRDGIGGLPHLGCGLGYRLEIRDGIFAAADDIDCVEIITDQYALHPRRLEDLRPVCERFSVIPHGVDLSIGSVMPLDRDYLRGIKRVSDATGCPYYSEHLCMTRAPGLRLGHLAPLPFTDEVLRSTVSRVRWVQDYLEKPLVLENVTYPFVVPGASMSQEEFFSRLVTETGCGILLDVHNVYTNSVNHHFDPLEFLRGMPLEQVVQVHIAGGYWAGEELIDGHSEPVPEETWSLLELVAARVDVKAVILEHDANFPDPQVLVDQVKRSRGVLQRAGRGAPVPGGA